MHSCWLLSLEVNFSSPSLCVCESSVSFSLCDCQEFSLQIFPDDTLCVEAGGVTLSKLNKGPPAESRRQEVGLEPWVLQTWAKQSVCNGGTKTHCRSRVEVVEWSGGVGTRVQKYLCEKSSLTLNFLGKDGEEGRALQAERTVCAEKNLEGAEKSQKQEENL